MHNQDGHTRRCLYCGRQFMPIHGAASFCCYGHYLLYTRGDVHIPEETITAATNTTTQGEFFPHPKPPSK